MPREEDWKASRGVLFPDEKLLPPAVCTVLMFPVTFEGGTVVLALIFASEVPECAMVRRRGAIDGRNRLQTVENGCWRLVLC